MEEIIEKVILIINTAKKIIEDIVGDISKSKQFKDLIKKEDFKFDKIGNKYRKFNLDLFDKEQKYYEDLYDYFIFHLNKFLENEKREIFKFDSSFTTIYFSILTDLLLEIIENNAKALLDDIIKFDITIICEIFAEKNKRLIYSHSFFLICVNELKEQYNKYIKINHLNKNDFIIKMDKYYKEKAEQKLNKVKGDLYTYIHRGFYDYYTFVTTKDIKNMNEIELDNHEKNCKSIKLKYEEYKNNSKLSYDFDELKSFCLNEEVKKYFIEYSKILSNKLYDNENEYENVLNNFVLPLNILDIELNDENLRIIYNIKYDEEIDPSEYNFIEDTFYIQFLKIKKEIDYAKTNNYENEIINIINDDNFIKEFISIMESKHVSNFFRTKRIYAKTNEDKTYEDSKCLNSQYEQFIKDIKINNFSLLKRIIRIKRLGYKIPAATGTSMRIFINPLLNFSEKAKMDELQRTSILKSALIILLLHEITNFLKYYPFGNNYPNETQKTHKGKENGQSLIFYLFGRQRITIINTSQSELINDVKTWESSEKLKEIFNKEDKQPLYSKNGELELYLSSKQEETKDRYKNKNKTDYCYW